MRKKWEIIVSLSPHECVIKQKAQYYTDSEVRTFCYFMATTWPLLTKEINLYASYLCIAFSFLEYSELVEKLIVLRTLAVDI